MLYLYIVFFIYGLWPENKVLLLLLLLLLYNIYLHLYVLN